MLAAPLVLADEAVDLERRRAEGFLAAVAAGDAEALAAYVAESFSPKLLDKRDEERWLDMARQLTARHGGMKVESMKAEPHHIEATASDARGKVLFTFDFEPEPPHKIAGLGLDKLDGDEPRGPDLPPIQIP